MNKKFVFAVVFIAVLVVGVFIGTREDKSDMDKFKNKLNNYVEKEASKNFGLDINISDFDLTIKEQIARNSYRTLEKLGTKNKIVFEAVCEESMGKYIDFTVTYDPVIDKVIKFVVKR